MKSLLGPFYALFVLGVLFASFFVVFHLANYSVNRRVARLTMLFFVAGTLVLLVINAILFFSIPPDALDNLLPTVPGTGGNF